MKFAHAGRRLSGIVVPLSAIRSDSSPGCGEFPDLERFGDLSSAWNCDLIQLLPVNDSGFQSSPYFALSAFALNPIYIKIGDLPEISESSSEARPLAAQASELRDEAHALVERFSDSDRVPYEELLKAKLELLRKIWSTANSAKIKTGSALDSELDAWIVTNPWVKSYAAFVALKSQNSERPWWEWLRYVDPTPEDIESLWRTRPFVAELRFWAWLQMRAAEQFSKAADYLAGKGIALMGDIPILMNKDSADVWALRHFFRLDLAAGAPPDMYAALGQNWGFPVYDWTALEREGYSFWTDRLTESAKYYSCYRIDHVLGFFRIWSLSSRESSGALGRFIPDIPITRRELSELVFSPERIRWLSQPHVPGARLVQTSGEAAAKGAIAAALDRIGEEELFLFKPSIKGEKDIEALPSLSPAARDCLVAAWRDRALFEYETDSFVATWSFHSTTCWPTLFEKERADLESLIGRHRAQSEVLWAQTGKRLLSVLVKAVDMLPCAEDLGAVPDCVPKGLEELGILGLRVLRWTRKWSERGQPYLPVSEYPELSVACASVHDSSSLREWWEAEADRDWTWRFAASTLGRDLGPCPDKLDADQVETILELIARSASRFAVYPIQDLLAMSEKLRPLDPKSERINVPGTVGIGNWSYRIPYSIDQILAEKKLATKVHALVKRREAVCPGAPAPRR
jgi:4-alpha-glucanotransferase